MWLHKLTIALLLAGTVFAQEDNPNDSIRRLRFRRPRPKQVSIDNEEGVAQGRPIPLRAQPDTATLLAAALQEESDDLRFTNPGRNLQPTDALESLLATAAVGSPVVEIPEEPLAAEEEPLVIPNARPGRPVGRRRKVPGVPRRRRPRPQPQRLEGEDSDEVAQVKGARRPSRPAAETVQTVERYSHMNEDGSFTFGYVGEDGSFREETRGVDCITRGKYGYIDPEGKKREFTYVSGLPCDIGEEGAEGADADDELQTVNEDPIDPAERFRTAQVVQLSDAEIPDSARPRQRQPIRRPEAERRPVVDAAAAVAAGPTRIRDPALASRRPRPQQGGNAFQTLLQVAGDEAAEAAAPFAPTARPAARRPAARPTPGARPAARPRPAQAAGSFNFDQELDSFTLNRPALSFDEAPRQAAGAPAPVGPNFSSELVFNPETGTFQTELRQQVSGQDEVRVSNAAAPAGTRRPGPTPTPAARPPTPLPVRNTFSATPIPNNGAAPFTAFQPLSFPSPTAAAPRPSPTPAAVRAPTPTAARPSPTPAAVRAPTPTAARPGPTPQAARPASPSPSNSFFFTPFPTVGSPRPVAPGQPATPTPFSARPPPPQPAQPVRPAVAQPTRPAPPQAAAPQPTVQSRPPPPTPQIQFGFTPVNQGRPQQPPQQGTVRQQGFPPQQQFRPQPQAPQRAPFTAFAAGVPPQQQQFRGAPRPGPPQGFAPRPQQQQLGVPPQLQQQQPGTRFVPFGRPGPQPQQQQQPFSVFNPNSFRG